jgi:hypothetical protein
VHGKLNMQELSRAAISIGEGAGMTEFRRMHWETVLKIGSWSALAREFSLGVLIWMKRLRYPLLALGVLFHLWLEYSLNVPLFQWGIRSAYVLFIDPKDVRHAIEWMRLRKLNRVSVE